MTSGRGIVHSERSPAPRVAQRLHGIQFWVALPQADEETAPAFHHHPAAALPRFSEPWLEATLILGRFRGEASPVATFAPMLYLDCDFGPGGVLEASDADAHEKAVYVVAGEVLANGEAVPAGALYVCDDGALTLEADQEARAILFGGAPLDGPRKLWWNFVSSRPERIEEAKRAWAAQAMGQVPGETDFIPLPEH
jgi:hypothetical protein